MGRSDDDIDPVEAETWDGPGNCGVQAPDDSIEHARRTFRHGIECDEPDRHGEVRNREPAITCGQ
ncbi:hypothetical protein Maq22A_c09675 [Methylobacterium aquaticum]|uniref:Uncharacterized protein n=1 Tax=Methylobacterium aquaticum TaxID=270351 RepID=A0A0C6FEC9_9HYPH|nr:hypothetical protein Maq22A_c09675 [Methylobacterium aquaticum]